MNGYDVIDDAVVLDYANNFTELTLGDTDPQGMCFTVSYTLSLYLQFHGVSNTIESCLVNKELPHYLVRLHGRNKTIIDPTVRQFDTLSPKVYMGKKLSNYGTYIPFEFDRVYSDWVYPLHHEGWTPPHPPEIKVHSHRCDIRSILKVTFKAAILLRNAMTKSFLSPKNIYFGTENTLTLLTMRTSFIKTLRKIWLSPLS
jgi:hypothetical protein